MIHNRTIEPDKHRLVTSGLHIRASRHSGFEVATAKRQAGAQAVEGHKVCEAGPARRPLGLEAGSVAHVLGERRRGGTRKIILVISDGGTDGPGRASKFSPSSASEMSGPLACRRFIIKGLD